MQNVINPQVLISRATSSKKLSEKAMKIEEHDQKTTAEDENSVALINQFGNNLDQIYQEKEQQ